MLLVFAYAVSCLMAMVGLLVRTPEVVNNASSTVIFLLTFVADTFVPVETFPSVLRTFAEWNPVSAVVQAERDLFGNTFPGAPVPDAWSLSTRWSTRCRGPSSSWRCSRPWRSGRTCGRRPADGPPSCREPLSRQDGPDTGEDEGNEHR